MAIMLCASPSGTSAYADRFAALKSSGHYRSFDGVSVSSLGLGTYLGNADDADDRLYVEAIKAALLLGCNLLDTAINYRCMRSERNIGAALFELVQSRLITRDEVVICTKGGIIPFDTRIPSSPSRYILEEYVRGGICLPSDIVAGSHCMAPLYLRDQVARSLRNLGVDCIDLYYLHNPETQLDEIPRDSFRWRLEAAFEVLEQLVGEGKIRAYGMATWAGCRSTVQTPGHISLAEVVTAAQKVGGASHHFKAIQLPYNMRMAEAWSLSTQSVGALTVPLLDAAAALGVGVFTSASIHQSRLARGLPAVVAETFPGFTTDAQRAIEFVRSTPGVTAALVGMKHKAHVLENMQVGYPPSS